MDVLILFLRIWELDELGPNSIRLFFAILFTASGIDQTRERERKMGGG